MKKTRTLTFFIKLYLISFCGILTAQNQIQQADSLIKNKYGLRIGVDLFTPITTFFDKERKGLEIVGDYRISKKYFAAAEVGYLEYSDAEDFFSYTTNGSYIKLGVDYNAYQNWLDMENLIYVGFRYGFSSFSQTLDDYTVNNDPIFDGDPRLVPGQKFDGLNGHWAEIVLGLKAEVLHNIFMGFSFSGKKMLSTKEPENFKNLYVPGFNRVFLNNFGFSINYSVSYLIPFYKKRK